MIALMILTLGLAFCVYLFLGGRPQDEVFHRIQREEREEKPW